MLGKSISKNTVMLTSFAIITAGAIAFTNLQTRDRIAAAERAAQQQTLYEIVPKSEHDNDLLADTLEVPAANWAELGLGNGERKIHRARHNGEISALIVPATAPDGYSGDIDMIVGVKRDGTIAAVRITRHLETPGLGDKIELKKHPWILSFNGKSLQVPVIEEWRVKKDGGIFDQFAGATITPRAVVNQIRRTLQFVAANHALLFDEGANTSGTNNAASSNAQAADNTNEAHHE